jgi:carbon monoxide dehydrogenase subunit G
MEIAKVQIVPAPPDRVWTALNDPQLLQACFTGKIALVDMHPPESYTLNFEGQGGMAGFAKGVARVALSAEGEATNLAYTASAQIGGKLAQIGSRLIDGAANKMAADFFAALARELEAAPAPSAAHDESSTADVPDASAGHEDAPSADFGESSVPDAPQVLPAPAPGSQAPT